MAVSVDFADILKELFREYEVIRAGENPFAGSPWLVK